MFALPFPGAARRSDGSGPPAPAEDARGGWQRGLVSAVKIFLIASRPPLFLHLTAIPGSALSTASMQIIGEYCGFWEESSCPGRIHGGTCPAPEGPAFP